MSTKEEKKDDAQKRRRNLMTEILDISISNARCQGHMKPCLVPKDLEDKLSAKRKELKAAKEAVVAAGGKPETDSGVATLKGEYDQIAKKVVRIGGDAPIAVAAVADYVVKATLRYAMDQTIASEHKMVEVAALHTGDAASSLGVWPLICDLPSVNSYDPENEAVLKAARAAANKALKELREAAKKAGELAAKKAKEGGASEDEAKKAAKAAAEEVKKAAEPKKDETPKEDTSAPKTNFNTYVDAATKVVKGEEAYKSMRVANRLREVLSEMVAELVARLSLVAKVNVLELLGVRTLNASHLIAIVKSIYVAKRGVEDSEDGTALLEYVSEKVERFQEHHASERTRKWEEMDPVKKAEIEAKRAAATIEKKKKEATAAKTKAIALAKKAKEITASLGA